MATKAEADRDLEDMRSLLQLAAFRRFLFRIVETSGICGSTYGSEDAVLFREGHRALGSEILGWVGEAHPIKPVGGVQTYALLTILSQETQSTPSAKEPRSGRYDRNSELDDDDDARPD